MGAIGLQLVAWQAAAKTINVTTSDSYATIEAAQAGDEVVIAPGTYGFRVYLEAQGTAASPIVIRAADPSNPPVWDLSSVLVNNAPGSYTAGDRGRGCWQFSNAAHIQLSSIVIQGCHNAGHNSAGIRYYNGATGIVLRDLVFRDNDNGLTGGTQDSDITVEFSEFVANGSLQASASAPSHNIYIYGGTFTLRYSYVHDPVQAQNFHIRAQNSVIEYNWFSRAMSYAGDLMTDDDFDGTGTLTQTMTFRGNVVVQGAAQANTSQIIAVYNDAGVNGLTLNVNAYYNTFIGSGGRAGFVHLSNADQTPMHADISNNIIFGTTRPVYADDASGVITGSNNWLLSTASPNGLTASVVGTDPGFTNAAGNDFTLAPGSACINAAASPANGAPDREYYRDENVTREYRVRAAAHDIGAFELTTSGTGIGPSGGATQTSTGGAKGAATGGGAAAAGTGALGGAQATGSSANTVSGGQSSTAPSATGGTATVATGGNALVAGASATAGSAPLGGAANGGMQSATLATSAGGANDNAGSCGCRLVGVRASARHLAALAALLFAVAQRRRWRPRARRQTISASSGKCPRV